MKTRQQLKDLHGEAYVEAFESQSPWRLGRLLEHLHLSPTDTVADFACGNGMLMELLAPQVASYVGIDFSEPFIAAAEARRAALNLANVTLACADINAFCRDNPQRFDAAFAMDFSEHVYDTDWLAILRSIRLSLKSGGRFYLHTPNADFFLERMKARNFIVKQFPEHIAVRSPEHNCALLRQAGFEIRQLGLLPHYNVLRLLHPLSFLPLIGKYLKARILIEASPGPT